MHKNLGLQLLERLEIGCSEEVLKKYQKKEKKGKIISGGKKGWALEREYHIILLITINIIINF